MAWITQKKLWSFISIAVPYFPLDNCLIHFYQWSLIIGPYENRGYALHFGCSDLVINENFSNSAAQFRLVGACHCACSLFLFQDDLGFCKAFRLRIFKCPKENTNFFERQVCLLNSFVPLRKQIK